MDRRFSKLIKFGKAILPAESKGSADVGAQTDKMLVAESGLFDEAFYTEQVGPIPNDIAPIEHFLISGASNLASPSRAFDSAAYVEKYKDVQGKAINPLLHYLKHGAHEGRQKISVGVQEGSDDQLKGETGSLKKEEVALIANSSYFDEEFYGDTYADLLEDYTGAPSEHYVDIGVSKNLKPSLYFDPAYYLKAYSDVKKSGQSALLHYVKFGEMEGRQPNSSVSEIPRSVLKKWAETPEGLFPYIECLTKFKIAERAKNWSDAENNLREVLELEYESAVIYNHLANMLRKQGKWWQEVEALKNAIELEGQHATWHYRLGEAQEVMSRFQQAAVAYANAIELKKGKADAEWYYRQGYCYAREGHDGPANLHRAKQAYQQAIDKDTKLDSKRFGIGVFHQKRGHWVQAAEAYARQLSTTPLDAELNYRLGMAYDRCYEWEKAERYYTLALGLEIEVPDWHYRLGFVRERQEKYFEASQAYHYAALIRDRHTPYWFYRWGYTLEQAGQYQQACDAYLKTRQQPTIGDEADISQKTYSMDGVNEEVKLEVLEVLSPLGEYRKQLFSKRQLVALKQQLSEDCTSSDLWYRLGNVYEHLQQWQQAAEAYQHAIIRESDHSPAWCYRLGYVLVRIGKYKCACEAFRETRVFSKAYGISEKILNSQTKKLHANYTEYRLTRDVQERTILFESNHGKSITCNPRSVFEAVVSDPEFKEYIFIWVVNDFSVIDDELKLDERVVFIKRNSDAYLKWLACSEFLINNSGFPYYFNRREGQKYLETWHGTPFKTLGKQQRYKFFSHRGTQRNFFQATHIITPNRHTSEVFLRDYELDGVYKGRLKETGYPRNDKIAELSLDDSRQKKIELGIDPDKPVVLYAPTWRGALGSLELDVEKLNETVASLSRVDCQVLFRGHNYLEGELGDSNLGCKVVPSEVSTNEILPLVDVLVTDYSSIFFDFASLKRPILLYTYDIESYKAERGLYFSPEDIGISFASSADNLVEMLGSAVHHGSYRPTGAFIEEYCKYDDGNATKRVVEFFFNGLDSGLVDVELGKKKNALIFPGSMEPNGITISFVNLINKLNADDLSVVRPVIALSPNPIAQDQEKLNEFEKLDYSNCFFGRYGYMPMGLEELYLRQRYETQDLMSSSEEELNILKGCYSAEFNRVFGLADIDVCINFSGYDSFWCSLFAFGGADKSICYLHNDLYSEYRSRFSYLDYNFNIFKNYSFLASVSEKTCSLNKKNLEIKYNIPGDKFGFVDNVQNPIETLGKSEEPLDDEDRDVIQNASLIYLTLGRLSVEKDHEKLIRAFSHVAEIKPSAKLLIVGEGPLKQHLANLIRSMGLTKNVHLMGRRRNPFPLLKAADCFVLSSNHEGQPMVLFEAMVLNKPIISTDIIGSRSVIEGRSGYLVGNNTDALAQGMIDFCKGDLEFNHFDLNDYQENAMNMFYDKVCCIF